MRQMAIELRVHGNDSGRDKLFASVAGRRFPAPLRVTNTGDSRVELELRMRPNSGARVRIADEKLSIDPGGTAETTIEAETQSLAEDDTVLEALVDGVVAAQFTFTVVSLAREIPFRAFAMRRPGS
jgi:hypothetical protein